MPGDGKATAGAIARALTRRWPDSRYLHVYEAPTCPDRQGRKIDVLILALWHTDRHEIDAVEVKVSYPDWRHELERTEWAFNDHLGNTHRWDRKPTRDDLAAFTDQPGLYARHMPSPPPAGFAPNVTRTKIPYLGKSADWRARAHRFWIACPPDLAVRVAADCDTLGLGWGVLACGTGDPMVLRRPTKNRKPVPLEHGVWLGIVRAAADSGLRAIERAYQRGRDDADRNSIRAR